MEIKPDSSARNEFSEKFSELEGLFAAELRDSDAERYRDDFLSDFRKASGEVGSNYIAVIQGLPADFSKKGTLWLQRIVDAFCQKAKDIVPSLKLFSR